MAVSITLAAASVYIGTNALVLVGLGLRVAQTRRRLNTGFADSADEKLQRILRGHTSAVETIPIAMLLFVAMAGLGTAVWIIHLFGAVFTAGRLLHAAYFLSDATPSFFRDIGAFVTTFMLAGGALGVVGHALSVVF